jgi:hypothetical protein
MISFSKIYTLFNDIQTELGNSFYLADILDEKDEAGNAFGVYKLLSEESETLWSAVRTWTANGPDDVDEKIEIKSQPIISINCISYSETDGEKQAHDLARNVFNLLEGISVIDFDFKGLTVKMVSPNIENRTIFTGGNDGAGYEYKFGFDIMIDYCDEITRTVEAVNTVEMTGDPEGDGGTAYDDMNMTINKP